MYLLRSLPSLSELIDAVVAEDPVAQEILREEFGRRFYRFTEHYLRDKGCAQPAEDSFDVENAAWNNIYRSIAGLENRDLFLRWGYTIFRNEANQHLRPCIEEQQTDHLEALSQGTSFEPLAQMVSIEEMLIKAAWLVEIERLAATIHPKLPKILYLRTIDDLDHKKIGERVGESTGNVRTILSRGLKTLRATLRNNELKD